MRDSTVPRAAASAPPTCDRSPAAAAAADPPPPGAAMAEEAPPLSIGVRHPPMGVRDPPAMGVSIPPYRCSRTLSEALLPSSMPLASMASDMGVNES